MGDRSQPGAGAARQDQAPHSVPIFAVEQAARSAARIRTDHDCVGIEQDDSGITLQFQAFSSGAARERARGLASSRRHARDLIALPGRGTLVRGASWRRKR